MRAARASLVVLWASHCAPTPALSPADDPPTAPAPAITLAPGQALPAGHPSEPPGPTIDPHVLATHHAIIVRGGRGFARAFRDVIGHLHRGAAVSYAVPVRAGFCYRFYVSAEAPVADLRVRVFDLATLMDEDGSFGAYALLGHRRPLCPDRDRLWRLEIAAAADGGSFLASALARSAADGEVPAGAVLQSPNW